MIDHTVESDKLMNKFQRLAIKTNVLINEENALAAMLKIIDGTKHETITICMLSNYFEISKCVAADIAANAHALKQAEVNEWLLKFRGIFDDNNNFITGV